MNMARLMWLCVAVGSLSLPWTLLAGEEIPPAPAATIELPPAAEAAFSESGGGTAAVPEFFADSSGEIVTVPQEPDFDSLMRRLAELEKSERKRTDSDKKRADEDKKKKEADAKKPTVKWSGQLQADFYFFDQDEVSQDTYGDIQNGEAFRRARLAMLGDYGPAEYRIEMDFALPGRPSFLDVYAGLHDVPLLQRVRVGHFFEPFSLERLTPNRYVTFMERGLPDQPFAPARNTGIMANGTCFDERSAWGVGFFRSDSDVFGDEVGDNFESAVTGRMTYLPYYEEACESAEYVHLGAAYSIRGANAGQVRFRSQPEARIGAATPNVPFFVDTGNIAADFFQLMGTEFAWVNGPFSLQSEFMLVPVDATAQGDLFFHAWYVTASYFLTGEYRPYNKKFGVFDRVTPKRDFMRYVGKPEDKCTEFGPGAWELAMRLSHIDLNDKGVRGGELTDLTVGANWYLNPYLRVTFNYIHAFANNPTDGQSGTNIFATRVGFEF